MAQHSQAPELVRDEGVYVVVTVTPEQAQAVATSIEMSPDGHDEWLGNVAHLLTETAARIRSVPGISRGAFLRGHWGITEVVPAETAAALTVADEPAVPLLLSEGGRSTTYAGPMSIGTDAEASLTAALLSATMSSTGIVTSDAMAIATESVARAVAVAVAAAQAATTAKAAADATTAFSAGAPYAGIAVSGSSAVGGSSWVGAVQHQPEAAPEADVLVDARQQVAH